MIYLSKRSRALVLTLAVGILLLIHSRTQASSAPSRGFIDLNGYYDTRDFNTLTINLSGKMPHRLEYFSLVNYQNAVGTNDNKDLTSFYTEQNLIWALQDQLPLALVTQWVSASGPDNDLIRFGVRWYASKTPALNRLFNKIQLSYFVNLYPFQVDHLSGHNWQVEHVYRLPLFPESLDSRVYIGGFADHNIGPRGSKWVSEHQLGVRIVEQLFLISEFRHNDYLSEKDGLGFGLEYLFVF